MDDTQQHRLEVSLSCATGSGLSSGVGYSLGGWERNLVQPTGCPGGDHVLINDLFSVARGGPRRCYRNIDTVAQATGFTRVLFSARKRSWEMLFFWCVSHAGRKLGIDDTPVTQARVRSRVLLSARIPHRKMLALAEVTTAVQVPDDLSNEAAGFRRGAVPALHSTPCA